MLRRGVLILCGSLVLFLGLAPCSSNAQTAATPPPPPIADQPQMVPSDRPETATTADRASYDRQLSEAVAHARKAEVAGNEGNIPEMLRHTNMSLEQAKAAQVAGANPDLDDGIANLKETIMVGKRDQIAPSSIKEARVKLVQASAVHPVSTAGTKSSRILTGELRRTTTISTFPEQEAYVVRDPQTGADTPVFMSPEMSRQVKEGDMVQTQIDSQGRVVAISPKSPNK
ncbi:exported protein of unknown function [Nitrospira japonica]|uniref:DUF5667 domain-containing protein n=1 Tax=Nitrospira japonica TaxID=1325564 RepID=A0A1W1I8X4_9BACT|nr:small metal-binding protein SmbP [Nitrospira japonica]SLM49467.1 exported protein of unknown function [Nitrospira japonica]